jgi:hypothetical protein
MHCPKCGKENPDNDKVCSFCGSELYNVPEVTGKIIPKMSSLAIAAFLFGIVSLFTFGLTIVPAIILGIISIVIIERSGGRVTGKGFAITGIIIAVLVFLINFVPLYRKVKRTEFGIVCGTNLSGIGKAMLIYAGDYDEELPRSGGIDSTWSKNIPNYKASNRYAAYGVKADGSGGQANISSCFYLLVKYAEVTPKSFICKGDVGATEFNPFNEDAGNLRLIDLWDFGVEPSRHCSYSYHMPFSQYALNTQSEPGMAVAADRNPWMDSPSFEGKTFPGHYNPDGDIRAVKYGNAIAHQEDAQNVLFIDLHVGQEKRPFCGINDDNIYTFWNGGDIRIGSPPVVGSKPQSERDSLLVHDGP